jgi:hypothetical protein
MGYKKPKKDDKKENQGDSLTFNKKINFSQEIN